METFFKIFYYFAVFSFPVCVAALIVIFFLNLKKKNEKLFDFERIKENKFGFSRSVLFVTVLVVLLAAILTAAISYSLMKKTDDLLNEKMEGMSYEDYVKTSEGKALEEASINYYNTNEIANGICFICITLICFNGSGLVGQLQSRLDDDDKIKNFILRIIKVVFKIGFIVMAVIGFICQMSSTSSETAWKSLDEEALFGSFTMGLFYTIVIRLILVNFLRLFPSIEGGRVLKAVRKYSTPFIFVIVCVVCTVLAFVGDGMYIGAIIVAVLSDLLFLIALKVLRNQWVSAFALLLPALYTLAHNYMLNNAFSPKLTVFEATCVWFHSISLLVFAAIQFVIITKSISIENSALFSILIMIVPPLTFGSLYLVISHWYLIAAVLPVLSVFVLLFTIGKVVDKLGLTYEDREPTLDDIEYVVNGLGLRANGYSKAKIYINYDGNPQVDLRPSYEQGVTRSSEEEIKQAIAEKMYLYNTDNIVITKNL